MRPVNEKSLLHFLFIQMEKLDEGVITNVEATAQAKLASQAIQLYRMEIDRAKLQMEINKYNGKDHKDVELRELSSKGFDDTTK